MGYRIITLDPAPNSPCAQVADEQIIADFSDASAVLKLGALSDVVTYEFENVDFKALEALEARGHLLRPGTRALRIAQDRILEKEFLRKLGIRTADFYPVQIQDQLEQAAQKIGFPAILKISQGGYDGKGQRVVRSLEDARKAFETLGRRTVVWEKKLSFAKELSVIAARDARGAFVCYGLSENMHKNNILDTSIIPARVPKTVERAGTEIAQAVGAGLGIIGTFCVEFFLLREGRLVANEIAPRPHNSGHYTIDACVTSQFEQQARAICGLPLGSVRRHSAVVMCNILGDGKGSRLAGMERVLRSPEARLHLYGKSQAKSGRKMGHLTILADTLPQALRKARTLHRSLRWVNVD
jgi:5-(carboxyamino)imidazole ribonucleotide synthase